MAIPRPVCPECGECNWKLDEEVMADAVTWELAKEAAPSPARIMECYPDSIWKVAFIFCGSCGYLASVTARDVKRKP